MGARVSGQRTMSATRVMRASESAERSAGERPSCEGLLSHVPMSPARSAQPLAFTISASREIRLPDAVSWPGFAAASSLKSWNTLKMHFWPQPLSTGSVQSDSHVHACSHRHVFKRQ